MANGGNQDIIKGMGPTGRHAADALDEFRQMFAQAEAENMRYTGERRLNHEMLRGEQWSRIRDVDLQLILERTIRGSDGVELLTDNVLSDLLVSRVSQLIGNVPIFEGVPATSEQSDVTKAKYVTKMAKAFWYYLKLVPFFRKMHVMAGYYNCSFGKVTWNPSLGDMVRGKPQGEVSIQAIPPFHMFVDPDAERVMPRRIEESDAQWLFHRQLVTIGDLKATEVKSPERNTPTGGSMIVAGLPDLRNIVPAIVSPVGAVDEAGKTERTPVKNSEGELGDFTKVWVLSFYQQPSEQFPRGRFARMLPDNGMWITRYRECLPDDAVQYGAKLPGLFPFFMIWDEQVPGQLAGRSRTAAAIPQQRLINKSLVEWNDARRRHQPRTYLPKGSIDPEGIIDDPRLGLTFLYDPRLPEEQKPSTEWPTAIPRFSQTSRDEIDFYTRRAGERMRINPLAYYPNRAMTATEALEAMRYDRESLTQEAYIAEECAYIPCTELVLQEVQRHYGDTRMVNFLGDRNRMEVVRVLASDLSFKDIIITSSGSSVPVNRRLMKAEVMNLVQIGYFSDIDPSKQKMKQMWLADLLQLESSIEMSADELDIKNARAENMMLLTGQPIPPPMDGDNHVTHLLGPLCHEEFYKSPEYRNLEPGRREAVYQNCEAHMKLHALALDEDANALAEMGVANPATQIVASTLNRIKPSAQPGQQPPGPVGMPPGPGQPVDTKRPDGTRVFREQSSPKLSNVLGTQRGGPSGK